MMSSRKVAVLSILLLVLMLPLASSTEQARASETGRSVTIPIKVILVGFYEGLIDTEYLGWAGSLKNLPTSVTNMIFDDGNNTGVVFHPRYTFTFAPPSFKADLVSYLRSIEITAHGSNPWFVKYVQDKENPEYISTIPVAIDYAVYDADSVEKWLWNHQEDVGGYPSDGWTIVISYLPDLPSITWSDVRGFEGTNGDQLPESRPHYYGISSTDSDLGYKLRYRDFMNAWGGRHRMWFVDFSAGPVFNSQWEDLPLQVALGDNNIDLLSTFGRNWLNEYVADYLWQATMNFIFPNFVYHPQYSPEYQIDVFILDDRNSTERQKIPIEGTVNKEMISAAFRDLVPYSEIAVNIHSSGTNQQLHDLIASNYKYADSWLMGGVFGSPQRYGVVDLRPVYKYMLDNIASFEPNPRVAGDKITIPVFAFALSGQTYFTYTYKWQIGKIDWETGALLGISLNEGVFISLNQWEFTRGDHVDPPQSGKGEGFTQTIIHELGHSFGLMHPHQYGNIGDFIFSPMGYFTNDYSFGQIDKDALQRAHVDEIYMETEKLLSQVGSADQASQARSKLAQVDSAYNTMSYATAMTLVLDACSLAQQAVQTEATWPVPASGLVWTVVYVLAGVVIGVVIGFALTRQATRKKESMSTQLHGSTLRRCSSCGNEIRPETLYCRHCGAKQA
jgi:hypothetical protein